MSGCGLGERRGGGVSGDWGRGFGGRGRSLGAGGSLELRGLLWSRRLGGCESNTLLKGMWQYIRAKFRIVTKYGTKQ